MAYPLRFVQRVRVLTLLAALLISMRIPLRRFYGRGDLHFVTFSCYRRLRLLGNRRAKDCFVRVLDQVRLAHGFQLFGYVVMPESMCTS